MTRELVMPVSVSNLDPDMHHPGILGLYQPHISKTKLHIVYMYNFVYEPLQGLSNLKYKCMLMNSCKIGYKSWVTYFYIYCWIWRFFEQIALTINELTIHWYVFFITCITENVFIQWVKIASEEFSVCSQEKGFHEENAYWAKSCSCNCAFNGLMAYKDTKCVIEMVSLHFCI